ncbi:glycoside hydrolase family 76 protein [Durotheca rogersii]|uniref:glycoside hydrolase family 76 protein n=1 Tax=Durotheca rogersii TaxID=419775 RepID=UPI00221F25F0|nr:glycoside hydrolase family 76 protein [Durotheca rogersii]KAI5864719.1 glycoside hydrolase family 76 protein [Durotheca rogersii]
MAPSLVRAISLLVALTASARTARGLSSPSTDGPALAQECSILFASAQHCDPIAPKSFLPADVAAALKDGAPHPPPDLSALANVLDAVQVMQTEYFAPWLGTWPESIDWTAAVMGTHVSAAARSLSEALPHIGSEGGVFGWKAKANLVDSYFTQLTAYYFGQDAFAIRNQAYDDMLWVVLGWLETIRLVGTHTDLHFGTGAPSAQSSSSSPEIERFFANQTYHGNQWVPAFAHRARIFWDLASQGWDTELCGGGMIWNPRLLPYKNAITNELFIAGSVAMYLRFPGDDNESPFGFGDGDGGWPPRDARYLKAAVEGYRWLAASNMTDAQGLYTDGFHIGGYGDPDNNNTRCDERNEVVYTYNQGVLLTGLRGLWEATGAASYLADGHALVQNVVAATGYDLAADRPRDDHPRDDDRRRRHHLPRWHGLGRAGVMEDLCDASATCSQDGQTFKGIFFHHLAAFCEPLTAPRRATPAFAAARSAHARACAAYGGWLAHNAGAALRTRDARGRFGQWWTAGLLLGARGPWPSRADDGVLRDGRGVDYRNDGVPDDAVWRAGAGLGSPAGDGEPPAQRPLGRPTGSAPRAARTPADDPNSRGRGRTVETQGGGLALLRAYWQIAHAPAA